MLCSLVGGLVGDTYFFMICPFVQAQTQLQVIKNRIFWKTPFTGKILRNSVVLRCAQRETDLWKC